jgi:hypothetical protein
VAVGDLHGDMPNARRALQFSGVVDEYGDWTGNVDLSFKLGILLIGGLIPLVALEGGFDAFFS